MKKRLIALLTLALLLVTTFTFSNVVMANSEIKVEINGEQVIFDEAPFIQDGRTLVPIRNLAEKMQFNVDYNDSTRKITLTNFNTEISLFVGGTSIKKVPIFLDDYFKKNTPSLTIDVPATVINGRTFIPLRAIAELFHSEVTWEEATDTVFIKYLNTYGNVLEFKDKSFEHLCRVAVTTLDLEPLHMNSEKSQGLIKNTTPVYDGPFYEGLAEQIKSLWFYGQIPPKGTMVSSIEDISKLPNLKNVYLQYQNISDISPLLYRNEYCSINISGNPISDYSPLKKILVTGLLNVGISQGSEYSNITSNYQNAIADSNYHYLTFPDYQISESDKQEYYKFVSDFTQMFDIAKGVINDKTNSSMSTKQKVGVVCSWILDNIEYDYDALTDDDALLKGNDVISVMLSKKGVCGGITRTAQMFCTMLDLKIINLSGYVLKTSWQGHMWNVVEIDGLKTHMDVTWAQGFIIRELGEDKFNTDTHKWEEENIDLGFSQQYKYGKKTPINVIE